MDNIAIESFISYCDDMMIAEEGFKDVLEKIKNFFIKIFTKFINFFKRLINKIKNPKQKSEVRKALHTASDGLKRSQKLQEGDTKEVQDLKTAADELQHIAGEVFKEFDTNGELKKIQKEQSDFVHKNFSSSVAKEYDDMMNELDGYMNLI